MKPLGGSVPSNALSSSGGPQFTVNAMTKPTSFKPVSQRVQRKNHSPQTVAEFIQTSFEKPLVAPRVQKKVPRGAGIWESFKTPEERSAYAKSIAAKRKPETLGGYGPTPGLARGWTREAARAAASIARIEADEMVERLKAKGLIDPDDAKGAKATADALAIVRSPGETRIRQRAAKRLLLHYHPDVAASVWTEEKR